MLGPKEFRDVLRFLAMDEPPLLPGSTANVTTAASGSRKRKFVEVPSDIGADGAPYKLEPSSVVEVPGAVQESNPFAMTVPSNPLPVVHQDGTQNNVLSIFSPINAVNNGVPSMDSTLGGFLTNGVETTQRVSSPAVSTPTVSNPTVSTPTVSTPAVAASAVATPTVLTPTVSTPTVNTPTANGNQTQTKIATASNAPTTESTTEANNQLAFLDEELPLLPDSDHFNFTDGEQAVMKKLEDFETSLLDEYDVSCLDTLLQQLKNSSGDKPAGVSVADPEEVVVGPTNASPHDA
ncbi:unnamed protein product [Phytophthora lilii]|uniref:Unnamed protein product n=1 Tax=Phytophthora lilii TaxID=2077276 RepID=A0A9W6U7A0_9STRA|nr:unnamed protein product [Phytophthora lilii]